MKNAVKPQKSACWPRIKKSTSRRILYLKLKGRPYGLLMSHTHLSELYSWCFFSLLGHLIPLLQSPDCCSRLYAPHFSPVSLYELGTLATTVALFLYNGGYRSYTLGTDTFQCWSLRSWSLNQADPCLDHGS